MGYLEQDEGTGKYKLGIQIFNLSKAMLANLPGEEIRQYLKRSFRLYTNHTITDSKSLRLELVLTRQRGYAVDNMEHEFGIPERGGSCLLQKPADLCGYEYQR